VNLYNDLMLTKQEFEKSSVDEVLPGFIHHASLSPVMVICYTSQQLELMRHLFVKDSNACIHIDATAKVIRSLEAPYHQKQIDVYMMAVSSKMINVEPIILSEFYTSDTSQPALTFYINHFIHK
jgi:hypothetical protein